jgi:hypothetical protein
METIRAIRVDPRLGFSERLWDLVGRSREICYSTLWLTPQAVSKIREERTSTQGEQSSSRILNSTDKAFPRTNFIGNQGNTGDSAAEFAILWPSIWKPMQGAHSADRVGAIGADMSISI